MKRNRHEPSKLEEPPEDFLAWWYPSSRDHNSGADIGGHPDSERTWSRKDSGRYVHRKYGTQANIAWNAQHYRNEYQAWIELGRPERQPFISLVATIERQQQFWRDLKYTISQIGQPPLKQSAEREKQNEIQRQKVRVLAQELAEKLKAK